MNLADINWLDEHGRVKPPAFLYLILAFLGRGWVIFVMSLTQASDRASLVKLIYPRQSDFIQALIVGSISVLIFALIIAERKRKPQLARLLFSKSSWLLLLLVALESFIFIMRLNHNYFEFHWYFALNMAVLFWCLLYVLKSKHLKAYFTDWQKISI